MRRAMADAEVGDDDYGEDPTVRALEEAFAERVGKPAALFVPSGVMANQIAVRVLATPGTAVVAGRRQHLVAYEYGAAALNAGVQFIARRRRRRHGRRRRRALGPPGRGAPSARRCRWSASRTRTWRRRAHPGRGPAGGSGRGGRARADPHGRGPALQRRGGDRRGRRRQWAAPATTVMCCLSKGLCAPVGSLLAGADGRHRRRRGWRASASAAACARRACWPRRAWWPSATWSSACPRTTPGRRGWPRRWPSRWPACGLDPASVRTNIVTFDHPEPEKLLAHLERAAACWRTPSRPGRCASSRTTTSTTPA